MKKNNLKKNKMHLILLKKMSLNKNKNQNKMHLIL